MALFMTQALFFNCMFYMKRHFVVIGICPSQKKHVNIMKLIKLGQYHGTIYVYIDVNMCSTCRGIPEWSQYLLKSCSFNVTDNADHSKMHIYIYIHIYIYTHIYAYIYMYTCVVNCLTWTFFFHCIVTCVDSGLNVTNSTNYSETSF